MESTTPGLQFEQPILELEQQLVELRESGKSGDAYKQEVRQLKKKIADTTRDIYDNLSPWDTVQVARHKDRPHTSDYLSMVFDEFVELHGDRHFGDDRALLTGFGKLGQFKVMVVGHQKGRTIKEKNQCFFGCAHPEGYRKALSKIKLAAKYQLPVITIIDTPGAYPGIGAEERGQAWVIAQNMYEMSRMAIPIICIVIGEGGSGGALGIGVGDRVAILQHAYYSVISPEGCSGILWKSGEYAQQAAESLRFTSDHLDRLGIVDKVIPEPLGGAHRDHQQMAVQIKQYLVKTLRELVKIPMEELLQQRYVKFRKMGVFIEGQPADESAD
ncbi:MAG: acetyl-CoA carboxylase carboxyltransferase subunit alpha [Pirellulaceae bacterium]